MRLHRRRERELTRLEICEGECCCGEARFLAAILERPAGEEPPGPTERLLGTETGLVPPLLPNGDLSPTTLPDRLPSIEDFLPPAAPPPAAVLDRCSNTTPLLP